MNSPRQTLPRRWSEGAFLAKFFVPALAFASTLAVGGSHLDASTFIPRLVFFSPLLVAGWFLLFKPGQLRPVDSAIFYRRWWRWNELPSEEIESIQSLLFGLGAVKLRNQTRRLLFVAEEENKHLLGFEARKETVESRRRELPTIEPANLMVETLFAVAGFVVLVLGWHFFPSFLPSPPPNQPTHDPGWVNSIVEFENRYQSLLRTILVVMLILRLRKSTVPQGERRLDAFFLGFIIAGYFLPTHVENLERFFR
jgi:hypothetical protein